MKWINVKDKFPEKGKYYLVYTITGNMFVNFFMWSSSVKNVIKIRKITHWAELPEAPKD